MRSIPRAYAHKQAQMKCAFFALFADDFTELGRLQFDRSNLSASKPS
jgi:hypothetical protein